MTQPQTGSPRESQMPHKNIDTWPLIGACFGMVKAVAPTDGRGFAWFGFGVAGMLVGWGMTFGILTDDVSDNARAIEKTSTQIERVEDSAHKTAIMMATITVQLQSIVESVSSIKAEQTFMRNGNGNGHLK